MSLRESRETKGESSNKMRNFLFLTSLSVIKFMILEKKRRMRWMEHKSTQAWTYMGLLIFISFTTT